MKRILAVILAVMLIASLGIIGASAAGEKLTFDATGDNAKGFTFDIYQVATLNTETGKYTPANAAVTTAVNTPNQTGAQFLAALQGIATPGTLVKDDLKEASYEATAAGIYYVKVVGTPDNVTKKLDSVVVWPQAAADGTYTLSNLTVNLSEKVNSGTDNVSKAFAENDEASKSLGQIAGTNTVDFLLTADVVGSSDEPATKFVIWDKMSKGLTYDKSTVKVYYDAALTQDVTSSFDISDGSAITDNDAYKDGTYFTVSAKAATLTAGSTFYSHDSKKVYVKYTATLNTDAVVAPQANPNKDGLDYQIGSGDEVHKDGNERKVFTYNVRIKKVKGDTTEGLNGPKFNLMKADGTTVIATGEAKTVNGTDGIVEFFAAGETTPIKLAPGTYKVQETETVNGYSLNTTVYDVTIADTKEGTTAVANLAASISVPNYPTKLPETGGAGTIMFTIIGGALVLLAGAMFVIIMKKRASSK